MQGSQAIRPTPSDPSNSELEGQIFLARQPIFNRDLGVHAYELLFRRSPVCRAEVSNGNQATTEVIVNAFVEFGLDELVGQHRAFINLTQDFLLNHIPEIFPQDRVVLEILEDIQISPAVIIGVTRLKEQGYLIALDDFIFDEDWRPLVEIADIIKLDVQALTDHELDQLVAQLHDYPVKLLAEKVENQEEFQRMQRLGFDYFQGYFLSKPRLISGQRLPANRINTLQLLGRINDPNVTVEELEELITRDPTLSFKMLRYLNSAHVSLPRQVESIRQAVTFLGLKTIRSWVSLMAMTSVDDKPSELLNIALVRSYMCQKIGALTGADDPDLLGTVGLFSTLDALMDTSMNTVLESLPLSMEITHALAHGTGPAGEILTLVKNWEQWKTVEQLPDGVDALALQRIYLDSLTWTMKTAAGLT